MVKHALRAAVLAAAWLPALGPAAPLSFEQALDLAVQRSEAARAARAGVVSASEAARAAGQMPDPTLRAGIDNLPITGPDRLSSARDSQTMKRIGLSQEWLSQDKRAARQAAAEALVSREAVQVQVAAALARWQTAVAYLDAYFARQALWLTTRTEHHADEALAAARARMASASGAGGASADVLALAAARGMAEDESAELRQQQAAAAVVLQRWVGLAVDELMPLPALPTPSEQAFVTGAAGVLTLQRELDLARQAVAVAASERQPNWTWEASYGQRTGFPDMVSLGVSIPLPVSRAQRQDRETAAKRALVDKAEAELAEAVRAAVADYRALASDAQGLRLRIERYRASVLTPAQQRGAAAMAAYRSNQAALASVFEARHAELEAERKLLTLQRDLARTEAQLVFKPLTPGVAP